MQTKGLSATFAKFYACTIQQGGSRRRETLDIPLAWRSPLELRYLKRPITVLLSGS